MAASRAIASSMLEESMELSAVPGRDGACLMTSAGRILALVMERPVITTRELARISGRTERSVWDSLRQLQREGLLERRRIGRRNAYAVVSDAVVRRLEEEGGEVFRHLMHTTRGDTVARLVPRREIGRIPG